MKASASIRRAIRSSGITRYAIAKATGIGQSTLSRFVRGQGGLSLDTLDKLADLLGLEIVTRRSTRKRRR